MWLKNARQCSSRFISTTKNSFEIHKKVITTFLLNVYIKIVCMHTHKQVSINLPITRFHKALKHPQAPDTSFTEKGHDELH